MGTAALMMNGPRHELFSRARLTEQQDLGVRGRHLLDAVHHIFQDVARADDRAIRRCRLVGARRNGPRWD